MGKETLDNDLFEAPTNRSDGEACTNKKVNMAETSRDLFAYLHPSAKSGGEEDLSPKEQRDFNILMEYMKVNPAFKDCFSKYFKDTMDQDLFSDTDGQLYDEFSFVETSELALVEISSTGVAKLHNRLSKPMPPLMKFMVSMACLMMGAILSWI